MTSETALRQSSRLARNALLGITVTTIMLVGACSFSFGSDGESQACERFTDVATEVETADMSAPGLQSSLERIHSDATSDGQDDVASAASDLITAVQNNDSSSLYEGLGKIEAACGPYGY